MFSRKMVYGTFFLKENGLWNKFSEGKWFMEQFSQGKWFIEQFFSRKMVFREFSVFVN